MGMRDYNVKIDIGVTLADLLRDFLKLPNPAKQQGQLDSLTEKLKQTNQTLKSATKKQENE